MPTTSDRAVPADGDTQATCLNRPQLIEQAARHEYLRTALRSYITNTVPALNIDALAAKIYEANRSANLWGTPIRCAPEQPGCA